MLVSYSLIARLTALVAEYSEDGGQKLGRVQISSHKFMDKITFVWNNDTLWGLEPLCLWFFAAYGQHVQPAKVN